MRLWAGLARAVAVPEALCVAARVVVRRALVVAQSVRRPPAVVLAPRAEAAVAAVAEEVVEAPDVSLRLLYS